MPGSITTKPTGGRDLRGMPTAALIGADFEQDEQRTREPAVEQRVHQPPAEEARQEVGWAPGSPALARWTRRTVRASVQAVADDRLSGWWRRLQRAGVRVRRGADQLDSPDPADPHKVARLEHGLREAARQPEEVGVVLLDAMGSTRWPEPAPDGMLAAPHPPRQVHTAGSTNRPQRIIGALTALSGQVDDLDTSRVGREQVSAVYRQLDQVDAGVRRVSGVPDNGSIHPHGDVQVTVPQLPRLEPVWLPTSAPWLNPIEKLWHWLRRDVLTGHRLADEWQHLRLQVNAFLDQFAHGSSALLRSVGLIGDGHLAYVRSSP
jgi:transposase